jgi:hypothetical protein
MKGPRELKRYVAKYREHLKACRWDDLLIFKMERCKKWFKRDKKVSQDEWG